MDKISRFYPVIISKIVLKKRCFCFGRVKNYYMPSFRGLPYRPATGFLLTKYPASVFIPPFLKL
jgi:hypothetical protein